MLLPLILAGNGKFFLLIILNSVFCLWILKRSRLEALRLVILRVWLIVLEQKLKPFMLAIAALIIFVNMSSSVQLLMTVT
ncbi:hypothetical protein CR513_23294 [Mucuna pruriens]|uniref:Uncharacterized protein n=1 Tax=Mucuna pruriens TaxID=157652 RepID=A0A371GUW7_MUCPR|nr:hypothetical protein CR513_23294 [Mucuna pruriens]